MNPRWCLPLILALLFAICSLADCYDPLDPNGNVTVTFDILQWTPDGYVARVSIQNYYQYRQVDNPGWKLGFTWTNNEIIWSISGAVATHRGNCSTFKDQIPHSCMPSPEIVDLMPDLRPPNSPENCCRGGLLAASAINPPESSSSFDIVVGNIQGNVSLQIPVNLTLLAPGPGYTCSLIEETKPTASLVDGGRRREEVLKTWKSTCTYSSYLANKTPVCCVSLSTFYSPEITTCPQCSCGCRPADKKTLSCIRYVGTSSSEYVTSLDTLRCTDHMCPIRIHWHIKTNYKDHWRVKLTVTNLNYNRNYTNWNILVHHPGFSQHATTYSFNTTLLHTAGILDDLALFWGLDYYNNKLLSADKDQVGSVSTEILLAKDHKTFTLRNGWALPRTIYFAGENCVMPSPDTYPMLPNGTYMDRPLGSLILFIIMLCSFKLLSF
uniref:COBRA-like protein 1 n=1 Tax=Erigeron canadensis TaxID=72917 RepID=UPI001CB8E32E|nr:COBRA-like protein 1 [Erigeron canadensis]